MVMTGKIFTWNYTIKNELKGLTIFDAGWIVGPLPVCVSLKWKIPISERLIELV